MLLTVLKCIVTGRNEVVAKVIFLHLSFCSQGGLPQCMLGYHHRRQGDPPSKETPPKKEAPPRRRHPPAKETPCKGDPLGRRPPCKGEPPSPLPRRPTPPKKEPPHSPHPRGELRGSDPGPQPRWKLRGIRSRPTPKGEIEGDQIQPPPPPRSRLRHTVNERPVCILLECILVTKTC